MWQTLGGNEDITAYTYEEYVVGKKEASITNLEALLKTVAESITAEPGQESPVYLLLDGVDEMEPGDQHRLFVMLKKLSTKTHTQKSPCKIVVSSRNIPILETFLRRKAAVSLSNEKVQMEHAISLYSQQRLIANSLRLLQHGIHDDDLSALRDRIVQKADGMSYNVCFKEQELTITEGMFLWARLVLDYLSTNFFYSRSEIMAAVETLPRKLSEL